MSKCWYLQPRRRWYRLESTGWEIVQWLCRRYLPSWTLLHTCAYSTQCLKKTSHLWLAITFTHMNGFWYFFGGNVTDKVGNQKTLYYATSNNLYFCTTWQNAETQKSHISLNWIVLYKQCTCALSSWKKNLSYVMCSIASNICWDTKISH